MSQTTVVLLILAAALLTALAGVGLRLVVGRNSDSPGMRRTVIALRGNVIGRVLFGVIAAVVASRRVPRPRHQASSSAPP